MDLGLGVHVDARGDHHLNELVVVGLCWADSLAETRTETVEGNVLRVTVVLAALGHSFRLTNLRTTDKVYKFNIIKIILLGSTLTRLYENLWFN